MKELNSTCRILGEKVAAWAMAKEGLELHFRAQGFPWKRKPTPKEELDLGDEIFRAPHFELLTKLMKEVLVGRTLKQQFTEERND